MIGTWWLFLYSPQSGRHMKRSTGCIRIAICFLDSFPLIFMCVSAAGKKTHLCLPTSTCKAACLILYVCVSIHECVRGQKWRCYPVVIHHTRDTRSPALLYTEAMFYKRITRQRAPGGHPLPPSATWTDERGTSTAFITHLYLFAAMFRWDGGWNHGEKYGAGTVCTNTRLTYTSSFRFGGVKLY